MPERVVIGVSGSAGAGGSETVCDVSVVLRDRVARLRPVALLDVSESGDVAPVSIALASASARSAVVSIASFSEGLPFSASFSLSPCPR